MTPLSILSCRLVISFTHGAQKAWIFEWIFVGNEFLCPQVCPHSPEHWVVDGLSAFPAEIKRHNPTGPPRSRRRGCNCSDRRPPRGWWGRPTLRRKDHRKRVSVSHRRISGIIYMFCICWFYISLTLSKWNVLSHVIFCLSYDPFFELYCMVNISVQIQCFHSQIRIVINLIVGFSLGLSIVFSYTVGSSTAYAFHAHLEQSGGFTTCFCPFVVFSVSPDRSRRRQRSHEEPFFCFSHQFRIFSLKTVFIYLCIQFG